MKDQRYILKLDGVNLGGDMQVVLPYTGHSHIPLVVHQFQVNHLDFFKKYLYLANKNGIH